MSAIKDRRVRPAADDHMVASLRRILADRERELFEIKGPCSNTACCLHYAHAGPCDCAHGRSR